jgi:hypothetical protein
VTTCDSGAENRTRYDLGTRTQTSAARAAPFFREALFSDFALQKTEARVNDELSLIEARLKCADGKRSFSASRGEPKR